MSRAGTDTLVLAVILLIADGGLGVAGESIWHPRPGPSDSGRDDDVPPKLLRTVTPQYPKAAYATGREGTVVLELLIDAEGRMVDARVTKSIAEFDRAALACVSRWHFIPAQRRGRPVPAMATAMVTFKRPSKTTPMSARGQAASKRE